MRFYSSNHQPLSTPVKRDGGKEPRDCLTKQRRRVQTRTWHCWNIVDNIGLPAQLCMSTRLRSTLPSTAEQLTPTVVEPNKVIQKLEYQQSLRKAHYDKGSRLLSGFKPHNVVRFQLQNHWVPATVVRETETTHFYIVQTPDGRDISSKQVTPNKIFTRAPR